MTWRAILGAMVLGGMAMAGPAVWAQALPTDRSELAYSYAPLVKRISPAVVNIYTATTARVQRRLPFPFPGVPQAGERVQNSLGSGVLVRPDGLIVTNAHVVKGADEIRVVLADRREFEAKLVTQDERYDLALLRIDRGEKFSRDARFGPIEVGDVVRHRQPSASTRPSPAASSRPGAQRRRRQRSELFIQTDAAINPGNSGAPVSPRRTADRHQHRDHSQTGGSVGSALPRRSTSSAASSRPARRAAASCGRGSASPCSG
jgi:serine protease Do